MKIVMALSENTIAIISLSIALLAFIISICDFLIARRALKISEIKAIERKPNLIPYLIDGFSLPINNDKLFAFYFSVTNRSSKDNSITRLDLKITYYNDSQNTLNLIFPHDNNIEQGIVLPSHVPFTIPIQIGAHQTISGWGLFKVTDKILENKTIENYEILIRDTYDVEVKLNPILIQER